MALIDRQSGARNWVPSLFAFFWILLAGFSTLYLVGLVVDPPAQGDEVIASTTPVPAPQGDSEDDTQTAEQVAALPEANDARGQDIDSVKTAMRDLTHKMDEFNKRLKPIEKILGPVAALPPATSVTTSLPTPEPIVPPEPEQAETPAPPAPVRPPEKPAEKPKAFEAPKPIEAPKPTVAAPKPVEAPKPVIAATKPEEKPAPANTAAASAAPEPVEGGAEGLQDDASAPEDTEVPEDPASPALAEESVASASPDDAPPADNSSAPAPTSTDDPSAPTEAVPTEIAKFDPVALPPAANDGSTRFGIEIGSTDNQNGLRPLWREYLSKHAALVAGLQPRRVLAPDKKWRLIAGPFSNAVEAAQACILFKKVERPCEATVFAGDSL
ncbi:MAG: SPOR domain-containing protein [Methyloceanibacter sp.]|uniref:SPOR domain-containing protein n=1 Tax=Methyloceanibacter sp. TaxID=1965321 RepID=UPI003D9B0D71